MQTNNTVKWTADDFEYVGTLVEVNETTATIDTEHGVMSFDRADGKLTIIKTDGIAIKIKPEKVVRLFVAKPEKASSSRSKKELAIEIIKDAGDITRKEGIALLIDQLGMTAAGASTYFAMAKKAIAIA